MVTVRFVRHKSNLTGRERTHDNPKVYSVIEKRTKNWVSDSWIVILAYFQSSRGPEAASISPVLCSVSRVSVNRAYVTF